MLLGISTLLLFICYWCNDLVVRAPTSQLVDLVFISPSQVIPKNFKNWYSQLPCSALSTKGDSVEHKLASLFVVSLFKVLNGMLPSLCGKQVVGPNMWPNLTNDSQTEHELLCSECTSSSIMLKTIAQTKTIVIYYCSPRQQWNNFFSSALNLLTAQTTTTSLCLLIISII